MYPSIEKLKTILLKESYISEEDSKQAEQSSKDSDGYVSYLIEHELLSKQLLGQAIAESYKIPFVDLTTTPPDKELSDSLPEDVARGLRAIPVKANETTVAIATDSPETVDIQQLQQAFPKKRIRLAYTLPDFIDSSFQVYEKPLETRFSSILQSSQRVAPEIVDEIIKDATQYHASDIHFEPQADIVVIRFRVDGTLHEAGRLPREQYDNVLNRIKVESGMRIDEHLSAQDGAMQRHDEQIVTDLRVSLIPTVQGEKIVMRVLSSYVQGFALEDLGLDAEHQEAIKRYAKKPFGMILTVGPTGSGKTTTLYSLLKMLNDPRLNITTIEDPVEYKMTGINQIQVREQGDMTFSRGLRAIVRQDPDVILVGEIRDTETAEIAVNAALTGHLLLSTFHANDASTAVPRLIDMSIEPFLLASTLEVVIAQRLVRKICDTCRYSLPTETALKEVHAGQDLAGYFKNTPTAYAGKGCRACGGTGYKGRVAVYEFIEVTPEMQDLIATRPTGKEIWTLASKQGAQSMFDDGITKVKDGRTTVSELLRVVEPPSTKGKP